MIVKLTNGTYVNTALIARTFKEGTDEYPDRWFITFQWTTGDSKRVPKLTKWDWLAIEDAMKAQGYIDADEYMPSVAGKLQPEVEDDIEDLRNEAKELGLRVHPRHKAETLRKMIDESREAG